MTRCEEAFEAGNRVQKNVARIGTSGVSRDGVFQWRMEVAEPEPIDELGRLGDGREVAGSDVTDRQRLLIVHGGGFSDVDEPSRPDSTERGHRDSVSDQEGQLGR